MSYSEKELLMLSNFVYLDASLQDGTVSEILSQYMTPEGTFTEESVRMAGCGGGLDLEQVSELFTQMKAECDANPNGFGNLSAARRLEESDVRGVCYTDRSNQEPVVVFRGTGGTTEAWQDNMYGGFQNDTRLQKVAADFVRYECGSFDNITVTGHSKGGNLSQYVTVMNSDKISACVSFDGQGMNDDFIKVNSSLISAASGKIKSISAHNDFVNILLTSIAGTVMYVENKGTGVDAHSSFYLLTSNEYDENGNFISEKEQSLLAKSMKNTTDNIVKVMGLGNNTDNIIIGGILGEAIATMVMADGMEDVKKGLEKAASEAMLTFSVKINSLFGRDDKISTILPSGGVYFDHDRVKTACAYSAEDREYNIKNMNRTGEVMRNLDINIASRLYAELAIGRIIDKMEKLSAKMVGLEDIMNMSCDKYRERESMITLQMKCSGRLETSSPCHPMLYQSSYPC